MDKEKIEQITNELFHFLNNKGINFICYIWDKGGEYGGGCQSADADIGDAMVVIGKLVKHFNIEPDRLYMALQESKFEMQKD